MELEEEIKHFKREQNEELDIWMPGKLSIEQMMYKVKKSKIKKVIAPLIYSVITIYVFLLVSSFMLIMVGKEYQVQIIVGICLAGIIMSSVFTISAWELIGEMKKNIRNWSVLIIYTVFSIILIALLTKTENLFVAIMLILGTIAYMFFYQKNCKNNS